MDRNEINAIGTLLMKVCDAQADSIIVAIGALGPSADCRAGNMLATVKVGADTETAEAVGLADAIELAKASALARLRLVAGRTRHDPPSINPSPAREDAGADDGPARAPCRTKSTRAPTMDCATG